MKKIGLCIAYTGTNYGQLLQAYATQEIIKKYGFQTEIICYRSGKNKGIKLSYGAIVVAAKKTRNKIKTKLNRKSEEYSDDLHKINRLLRIKQADSFRKTHLNEVVHCNGIDELRERSKEYLAVLVGSDQVWLPDIAVTNFFTLRFAVDGVRRISYATSLGVSAYPNYVKKSAADFWKDIDFLSVREEQGKAIIQSIIDVDVKVVADPTYLFTKTEWETLIPSKKVVEDGYVLCYFLGDSDLIKQYAKKFAKNQNKR